MTIIIPSVALSPCEVIWGVEIDMATPVVLPFPVQLR